MWLRIILYILGTAVALGLLYGGYLIYDARAEDRKYEQLTDSHDLPDRIAKAALKLIDKRAGAKLVIGVYQRGKTYVKSFGDGKPPSGDTPDGQVEFEIGSMTKVFTGIVLARLVREEKVKLDDSIDKYLPATVKLPVEVKAITLKQLATHTSGLPRLPENLEATMKNEADPYANYQADDLYACLSKMKLKHKPGKTSDYSNLGMGLLGHILALRSGKSFEDLVKESICTPLGMRDTAIKLNESQGKRLVPGYDNDGKPASNWTFDVLAPAGGLRSTLDDMMAFLKANIEGTKDPLQTDLLLAQQKHYSSLLETIGLGWNSQWFASGLMAHWHNGGTGGYSSFMAFSKEHKTGVVLLYNISEAETEKLDRLGIDVLKWATKISLEK